jgi:hypothetical protein
MSENEAKSTIEKISTINSGNGMSSNLIAYKLLTIINKAQEYQVGTEQGIHQNQQDTEKQLSSLLNKNLTSPLQTKEDLKNKYLQHYLDRFNIKPTVEKKQDNQTIKEEVQKLIEERKKTILDSKSLENIADRESYSPHKLLIPAVIQAVIEKGSDFKENLQPNQENRIFETAIYRFRLLIEEGKQHIQINRKLGEPGLAFEGYKKGNEQEFKVIQNNLTPSEIQSIIKFSRERQPQVMPKINEIQIQKDDDFEL